MSKVALHEVLVEVCSSARNRKFETFCVELAIFFVDSNIELWDSAR